MRAQVTRDGAVSVEEDIHVSFSGSPPFTFGFREIPVRRGERVQVLGVSERGQAYRPGASTELEPGGPPGTYGVRQLGERVRVVWRFVASNATRTFTVRYRTTGLAVGYDDVVDVNLKVWGDEWEQSLGRLTATMTGPGRVLRSWGHPVWVRGDVQLAGQRSLLRALDVPAGQFVEQRTLYPRSAFTSTGGMRVVGGRGLGRIVAEEREDAYVTLFWYDCPVVVSRMPICQVPSGCWLIETLTLSPALTLSGTVCDACGSVSTQAV